MLIKRITSWYTLAALTVFNVGVAFVLINVGLWAVFTVKDALVTPPKGATLTRPMADYGYGHMRADDVERLRRETWNREFIYEPYTQFREAPFIGEFIHVTQAGFRKSSSQQVWPPQKGQKNIFFFGGSTTFGWGVKNSETIPAWTQSLLNQRGGNTAVYNFGSGYYYSTQERIRFEKLLTRGFQPDAVVFIDGLNEMCTLFDQPHFSQLLHDEFSGAKKFEPLNWLLAQLPLQRVWQRLQRIKSPNRDVTAKLHTEPATPIKKQADIILDRYLKNIAIVRATAQSFKIKTHFVWQPVPYHRYNRKFHYAAGLGGKGNCIPDAYTFARQRLGNNPHIHWLADIAQDIDRPIYVDDAHYSADFSKQIAEQIVEMLVGNSDQEAVIGFGA